MQQQKKHKQSKKDKVEIEVPSQDLNLDIAFMLDCTSSMLEHMELTKDKIRHIVEEIKYRYGNDISLAFVGYRDYDDTRRFELLDFTNDVDQFKSFLGDIEATGGDDFCEDVFGGFQKAIKLNWSSQTRCLIHIADAPCHGSRFHDLKESDDEYADNNQQDINGLRIENLISDLKEKKKSYYFGKLDVYTDKMINVFREVGGNDFVCFTSFVKKEVDFIREITVFSANRVAETFSGIVLRKLILNRFVETHKFVVQMQSTDHLKKFHTIHEDEPDWSKIPQTKAKISTYNVIEKEVSGKFLIEFKKTYKDSMIKFASFPFSKGSERYALFCIEEESESEFFKERTTCANRVIKTSCHNLEGHQEHTMHDTQVKLQSLSRHFAEKFNKVKPANCQAVHFVETRLVQVG